MKRSALKRQKISNIWAKGPKEMRKKEGEENDWRKVSDVAVILQQNILILLLLGEVRPLLVIPLASHVTGPFCVQCKAEITLPSLQMLLVQLDQQMPQRKRTAGSYKQGYFSLPYPLATGNQRCSIMLRHNLPCQTPGSLGVLWFWSLVLTLRVTSCALPRVSLDVCTVQSSHQVTTSFPNKKLYRIVPPEMQPSPY